jgi:hypothetical protein
MEFNRWHDGIVRKAFLKRPAYLSDEIQKKIERESAKFLAGIVWQKKYTKPLTEQQQEEMTIEFIRYRMMRFIYYKDFARECMNYG